MTLMTEEKPKKRVPEQSLKNLEKTPFRFTKENAKEYQKKAQVARLEKKKRAEELQLRDRAARQLFMKDFPRSELKDLAFATVGNILDRILAGDIVVRNGSDAAAIAKAAIEIARLEAGEATSQTAHLTASISDLKAGILDKANRMVVTSTDTSASETDTPPASTTPANVNDASDNPKETEAQAE